jgi:hypothetical protein
MVRILGYLGLAILLSSCIGDDFVADFVEPVLRITRSADTLAVGDSFDFEYEYFNEVGQPIAVEALWSSSNPAVVAIDALSGRAEALTPGEAELKLSYGGLEDAVRVTAGSSTVENNTERSGIIRTTSSYLLQGSFVVRSNTSGGITISIADDYRASTALPGLYVYLTNNPATRVGALEIGRVMVFSGAHSYDITNVGLDDYAYLLYYCKPFNVKVGDGNIN